MALNIKEYIGLNSNQIIQKANKENSFEIVMFYKKNIKNISGVSKEEILSAYKQPFVKKIQELAKAEQDRQCVSMINQTTQSPENSFEKVTKLITDLKYERSQADIREITLYDGLNIDFGTQLTIDKIEAEEPKSELVVLINREQEVVAWGRLADVLHEQKQYVLFDAENIKYDKMKQQRQYQLVTMKGNIGYTIDCEFGITDLKESTKPLCIDFGTSNTTVGTLKSQTEEGVVKFFDSVSYAEISRKKKNHESHDETDYETFFKEMTPTIIYVQDCEKEPKYLFGYDARKQLLEDNLETKASVFYEMKRWMIDLNQKEQLIDMNGNQQEVERRQIVEAYLRYVIREAENDLKTRFKTLHFSAPVKMKAKFIAEITKMLPEYTILTAEESLDEGVAIVYNHIHNQIQSTKNTAKPQKITILDCGGGTTDLATCTYEIREDDFTGDSEIVIQTQAINGDSNFGGNNLTYRILQLLKIKIANQYVATQVDTIDTLIPYSLEEILEKIDGVDSGKQQALSEIMHYFNTRYDEVEMVIPTIFKSGTGRSPLQDDRNKMMNAKKNYYYLWEMAETIKKEFFRQTSLLTIDFGNDVRKAHNTKLKLDLQDAKSMTLYHVNGEYSDKDKTEKYVKTNIDLITNNLDITIKEVEKVLYADIYYLLAHILGANPDLEQKYALSGQSCKITLFNTLLKEFIPGQKMRSNAADKKSEQLKLQCLRGTIQYLTDKECGQIDSILNNETAKLLYTITEDRKKINLLRPIQPNEIKKDIEWTIHNERKQYVSGIGRYNQQSTSIALQVTAGNGAVRMVEYEYLGKPKVTGLTSSALKNELTKVTADEQMSSEIVQQLSRAGYVYVTVVPDQDMTSFYVINIEKISENDVDMYILRDIENYLFDTTETTVFFDGVR